MLAKSLSQRLGVNLVVINGPDMMSGVVGESEESLRRIFQKAQNCSPCILFMDEVDGLCPRRDTAGEVEARVVATLLALMDGVGSASTLGGNQAAASAVQSSGAESTQRAVASVQPPGALLPSPPSSPFAPVAANGTANAEIVAASQLGAVASGSAAGASPSISANRANIGQPASGRTISSGAIFVLGATNRASAIDPALRRPGRFDVEIQVGIPSQSQRADILKVCLARYPHAISDAEIAETAERLHGYVGADIAALCREAALAALRRCGTGSSFAASAIAGDAPTFAIAFSTSASAEGGTSAAPVAADVAADALADALAAAHISTLPAAPPSVPAAASKALPPPLAAPSPSPPITLTMADLKTGIRFVQPSSIREVQVEVRGP